MAKPTKFTAPGGQFNDSEVEAHKEKTIQGVLAEYNDTHTQVMTMLAQIPVETRRQTGTLPRAIASNFSRGLQSGFMHRDNYNLFILIQLPASVPEFRCDCPGTLPWYGMDYALDDFLVYTYYGHKREHCAQIAAFRDHLQ